MKLVTARQIQEIDSIAIKKFRIPSLDLMENAGFEASKIILKKIDQNDNVAVIVGKGNNGGDGLVIARYLIEHDITTHIVLTSPPETLSEDSKENLKKLKSLKPKIVMADEDSDLKDFDAVIKRSDIIIDAIFGVGLNSEIKGRYKKIIEKINQSSSHVFAIDIPSGISADTGEKLGVAVRARVTITFGLPKLGQVLPPAPEYVKELYVVDIGFPKELTDTYMSDYELITPELFKDYFKDRKLDSNKGDFGHLLVLAGSKNKMGAGWLTSKAALRSGAGLVTYGLPEGAYARFDTRFAEVMVEPIHDKMKGRFVPDSLESIKKACQGKDAVAFGPGIETRPETQEASLAIIAKLNLPLVVDADGLNNLAGHTSILDKRRADTVLTPHPGEMAKLTSKDKKAILQNRIFVAKSFAKEHKVYLVLKGHRTIVATPDGKIFINPTGNPGMSTAGIGDALTGMIGSFIAGKIPTLEAVLAGVYIHGLAGDISASKMSELGMITSDLIENIPAAIKIIKQWQPSERYI